MKAQSRLSRISTKGDFLMYSQVETFCLLEQLMIINVCVFKSIQSYGNI